MKNRLITIQLLIFVLVNSLLSDEVQRVWIYFKDKGKIESKNISETAKQHLSKKSINRRAQKSKPVKYDFSDLPVNGEYMVDLKNNGVSIIHKSKWLNAVSAHINDDQYKKISGFDYIKKIVPVKSFRFSNKKGEETINYSKFTDLEYGPSFTQNNMHGIPAFHSRNYDGSGVLIAMFDTGFKLTHEALQSVNILHTRDFVENDNDVTGGAGESHGAHALGIIAGYNPGNLIGAAHGADFVLAKTDDWGSETHRDEDNWVAAAEWADSLGADIISSSIGYNLFEKGEFDYTYEDMDGNTTIVTIGADMAVKKGIAVFSTAGNEGLLNWYHIIAPADGDSVFAIGNITAEGLVNEESSRGPSFDGRIKPDFVAFGTGIVTISASTDTSYIYKTGTSFSTPLAAGAGALVLSFNPNLSPMDLYSELIQYASNRIFPNNDIGYGIINIAPIVEGKNSDRKSPIKVSGNPFYNYINIKIDYPSEKDLTIYNALGQKIKTFNKNNFNFTWYGESDNNIKVTSGVYFIVMEYDNSVYAKKIILMH